MENILLEMVKFFYIIINNWFFRNCIHVVLYNENNL